jgi:hypothetical protein
MSTNTTFEKKIRPEIFEKLQNGEFHFDVRLADFKCNRGDTINYREWDPETNSYTGREVVREVTHCLSTKELDYWTNEEIAQYGFNVIRLKK